MNTLSSQTKYLWFELQKCKKICKKHDEFWYKIANEEKVNLLSVLKTTEREKFKPHIFLVTTPNEKGFFAKQFVTNDVVKPKRTRKPLVKDAKWRQHRTTNERIRRAKLRKTNPEWHKKQLKNQKNYYEKNPDVQIKSSTKWNQEHKARKNANNRASYARNAIQINARRRKARKLKHG